MLQKNRKIAGRYFNHTLKSFTLNYLLKTFFFQKISLELIFFVYFGKKLKTIQVGDDLYTQRT